MLARPLRVAYVALIVLAKSVSAALPLSLKVTGIESVHNIENFKVKVIVTNNGDETLNILNDPQGPLSKAPTDTFTIINPKGEKPSFSGIKVKYVPSTAAANGGYTVLAPGQSTEVEHNLSEAYDFSAPGEGSYDITANNLFYIVDESSNIVPTYANHDVRSHKASLTGRLFMRHSATASGLMKRVVFSGNCNVVQKSQILDAAAAAQTYASACLSYLTNHTSSTPRFSTWFGTYTTAHHDTVTGHFNSISGKGFSSFTYDCSCTQIGVYAYVYPGSYGTIYLCPAFWNAPQIGTDSQAGTLVHEASHFTANGGTQDYVYGQSGTKSLAISNSGQAILNADSHEYIAENNPALS